MNLAFTHQLFWIRHYTNQIAMSLRGVDHLATMDDYDLRMSAADLREAADKLDAIRLRASGRPMLVAAE